MKTQINRHLTKQWLSMLVALALIAPVISSASGQAQAQTNSRTFRETGKTVKGKFLAYWDKNGGLPQQGFPISEEMQEVSETDGKTYTVQYFERAVFELHPENQPPHDVLLSLLGVFYYKQKYGAAGAPNQTPNREASSVLVPETGKRLGGVFLDYWKSHGGLPQQGFPISDEFNEVSDLNGKSYKVQYFERAVFEYHPENQPPHNVLLSQLGTFRYRAKYLSAPPAATRTAVPPTRAPNPTPTVAAPEVGRVVATIRTGDAPVGVAVGEGAVWVAVDSRARNYRVLRIDPRSNQVIATIPVSSAPAGIAVGEGGVWATSPIANRVFRIDPQTNQLVATISVGQAPFIYPAVGLGSVWTPNTEDGTVSRIDAQTNQVVATIPIGDPSQGGRFRGVTAVAIQGGEVWVTNRAARAISRIDPETNSVVATIPVGFHPYAMFLSGGTAWLTIFEDEPEQAFKVLRVDLQSGRVVADISVEAPTAIVAAQGAIWFVEHRAGRIAKIDPATNQVVGKVVVGDLPGVMAFGEGALWVCNVESSTVSRIAPNP